MIVVGAVGVVAGIATIVFAHPLARLFNEFGPFTFFDSFRVRVAGVALIPFGILFVAVGLAYGLI